MDKLDLEVKAYLESARRLLPARDRLEVYPSVEDYYRFVTDSFEGPALERMLGHLRDHPEAQELVRTARMLLAASGEAEREKVPPAAMRTAQKLVGGMPPVKCPHCGQAITPFKKPLVAQKIWTFVWGAGAGVSLIISFVFPYRFMQFLVLTLLFGVKWIVDQRAQKTQILVYKALSESATTPHEHLHQSDSHL